MQFSTDIRNARLNAIETTVGTSPILRMRTGAAPANCAASDSGTVLAEMTLPSDWMADAASGSKAKLGTWQDLAANAAGQIAHFRVYESTGATCKIQGTVGITGTPGVDMTVDNDDVEVGQAITITSFSLADGNA